MAAEPLGAVREDTLCARNDSYFPNRDDVRGKLGLYKRESLLFGSPLGRVRGVLAQDTTWIGLVSFWFHDCLVWWIVMSSSVDPLAVDQSGAAATESTPLPGTFLGLALDLESDRLYDLVNDIPDVMGLRALRPSAATCKVMSVPPDDHVSIGFHEILIHDLAQEEWPLVTLSGFGCLRLDWPKTLFTFMGRYQVDLEQMQKECRERFGSTQSGACTTCGKYIKMNLGKHVALYHLELAQLWRCPVSWCTIWKGTAQDCVNHMRRVHDTMDSDSRTVAQHVTTGCGLYG